MSRYKDITAHQLIAETCVGMAEEIYEELCSGSNAIYKVNGNRRDFVQQCAPTLKAAAKGILGSMLNDPALPEPQKNRIYEALCLDHELPKGGTSIVPKGYRH